MQGSLFPDSTPGPKNFVIYRSSAGSGKTYTLTREYLTLALRAPQYFRSILAVTFTNKATQEMKTRIIETLHELAEGKKTPIQGELQEATSLPPDELQERAQKVLSAILHNYSYFAVSTIDSFFQTVIRAFAREVGLQAGFKVELEQDKVLEDLIDLLLKDVEKDRHLREWLIQYATDRVDEGYTWDIRQDIKNLANEIFREDFKRHERKLQEIARDPNRFLFFLKQLKELRESFEHRMKTIGEEALHIMDNYRLEVGDFSSGTSGVAGYFLNILPDKGKYEPGTRARNALHEVEKWYTKTSKKKEVIEAAVLGGLNEKLGQALDLFDTEYTKYNTAKQVLRFVYTFGILASLTDKLRQYREEHDLMLISDASVFLRDIIGENEAPFIYEKTGSAYQHFLIDEFQDTSGFQWDNFKPLVANSVATGHYNLVVGDTKQSIYRWRGGDWQLLLSQVERDIGLEQTKNVELSHNWRSCREIIAFNNQTFYHAAEMVKELYIEQVADIGDEAEEQVLLFDAGQIAEAYKDVFQHFPAVKGPDARCGHVDIRFLDKSGAVEETDEEEELEGGWKAHARQHMLRTVEKLQDKGYRLKDMALLVRTKGEGKELADALMEAEENKSSDCPYHYRVVSNESLFLDSAASVCLLLNILRYMNNPQDVVARAAMIHDYQRYIRKNEAQDLHQLFRNSGARENKYEQFLPGSFLEKRTYLNKLPLYELMENLILEFELNKIKGEWAYLQAFQDAVLHFTKTERGDIDAFLEWWMETGYKTSVQLSESLDAIRIYTIHTSKGLQFKAVIMPYCNWKLDHNTQFNNILWTEAEQRPFNKMEVMPIKYTGTLKQTIFRQDYYRELMKAYLDNLNLLYVAFTRAEEALFACLPLPTFEKKSGLAKATEINGLLYRLLSEQISIGEDSLRQQVVNELDFSQYWNAATHSFCLGELEQARHKEESSEVKQISLDHYFCQRWRNRLAVKKRSGSLSYTKSGESAATLNWNETIQTVLVKLEYRSDLPRILDEVYFEGLISREEQEVIRQKIQAHFEQPLIGHWFSEEWQVRTSLPILVKEGFITRPDRVLTRDKEAIAIDFKAGEADEAHHKRVKLYTRLLKGMQYQQVKGYLLYLDSGEVVEVV
ncbi:UvrD-helicase domain-containing protein [Nafulsella turpanensis]|uniref:UvrD-helicase domain-containing protein n=1 Tax=Nafulsella turpanensis TaxID=1265690 RepID=UPI00037CA571|nr:UvrD-helicase domain-containing protein [Nafulsella turpanensis]